MNKKRIGIILIIGFAIIFFGLFSSKADKNISPADQSMKTITLISPAFTPNGPIPSRYTCDGDGISPPLEIKNVPREAKSLALIMEDPDVPKNIRPDGVWDHWVVWNMPPETKTIPEGSIPPGIIGKNSGGKLAYAGPCPPDKEHRYLFKIFALDTILDLSQGSAKADLETALTGHIIAQGELIGRYNRK